MVTSSEPWPSTWQEMRQLVCLPVKRLFCFYFRQGPIIQPTLTSLEISVDQAGPELRVPHFFLLPCALLWASDLPQEPQGPEFHRHLVCHSDPSPSGPMVLLLNGCLFTVVLKADQRNVELKGEEWAVGAGWVSCL